MEKKSEIARRLHHSGCNCCQSVLLAFAEELPIDSDVAKNLAAPFGRGISGLREVCGCVSAMTMVAGLTGRAAEAKRWAELFRTENGDINCARLLQIGKKPCNDLVACAAEIIEKSIEHEKR